MTRKLLALFSAMLLSFSGAACAADPAPAPKPGTLHVAFMIDDGPGQYTADFLKVLAEHKAVATFDLIGSNVIKYPKLASDIADAGHGICNHSLSHLHPKDLSDAQLETEILEGAKAIETATHKRPENFWPPFLEVDPRMQIVLARNNMKLCQWPDIASGDDWIPTNGVPEITRNIVDRAKDGGTILMHEFRKETLEALPGIIEGLRARGAVFLTYDELQAYRAANHMDGK